MSRSVTILGPVPPPRGGVSVHVLRLKALLEECGNAVRILPWSGYSATSRGSKIRHAARQFVRVARDLPRARGEVIHLHYATLPGFLALLPWLRFLPARWVLTLHSVRMLDDLEAAPAPIRRLALAALERFRLIVCVRRNIRTAVEALRIRGPETIVVPAFLPPSAAEREIALLPDDLREAMRERRTAGVVQLACAAYYLGPGYGQADLYGVETLAEDLAAISATEQRRICLVVMVSQRPEGPAAEALARLQATVDAAPELDLDLRIGCPLVPVLTLADLFVRPSREDGDSVAIREALAVGCPVIASDVVDRPEGVRTFPIDDADRRRARLTAHLDGSDRTGPTAPDANPYRSFADAVVGVDPDGME